MGQAVTSSTVGQRETILQMGRVGVSLLMGARHIVWCLEEHLKITQFTMGCLGNEPKVEKGRDQSGWGRNKCGKTDKGIKGEGCT